MLGHQIEPWVGVIMWCLIIGLSTTLMRPLFTETDTAITANYEDKTQLTSRGGVDKPQVQLADGTFIDGTKFTMADLVLSLFNMDRMNPYPKAIKVNDTPVVRFTNSWMVDLNNNVSSLCSSGGSHKFGAILDKQIVKVTFVHDDNGDYWHFITE